jgi:WD40 repeat protein
MARLRARATELMARIERDHRELGEVWDALSEAEAELDMEVLAPVANGVYPTTWLPEELLVAILIQVVTDGVCGLVCRRWYAVCQGERMKRRAWEGRWEGYSAGWRKPQRLVGHKGDVVTLAVGPDGTVYSTSMGGSVRAWSGTDGSHLRTLEASECFAHSLAVGGPNGTVYAGIVARTLGGGAIWGWSGTDGSRLVDLEGHPNHDVRALAVAVDGTLFSGASDTTIRVWSNGEHVRTLIGHTNEVTALAIGTRERLYSCSVDTTIRVWSVADLTHMSTLKGHTDWVRTVAVGPDGTLYSGSDDTTIRMWSGDDGRPLRTLRGHTDPVMNVAVCSGGTIYSASEDKIRVWCGPTGAWCPAISGLIPLALGRDNKLYSPDHTRGSIAVW